MESIIKQIIPVYVNLLTALFTVSAPLAGVLFSLFAEAREKLTTEYSNKLSQNSENIKKQNKELKDNLLDPEKIKSIQESINKLKSLQKIARVKLTYSVPKNFLYRLFLSFCISIIFAQITLNTIGHNLLLFCLVLLSLISFSFTIHILFILMEVLVELYEIKEREKTYNLKSIKDLISKIIKNTTQDIKASSSNFVDPNLIILKIRGVEIKKDVAITLSSNQKEELKISLYNKGTKMIKDVELGLAFPKSFIIEKNTNISIYSGEKQNIVRRFLENLRANCLLNLISLFVTPVDKGEHRIRCFISAENVEYKSTIFKIMIQ